MKRIKRSLGMIAFWLGWPVLFFYLRYGKRTRVLLLCGDKVLVVRSWHGSGKWSLPGGGLHKGEDPKVGAVRELREETGIRLETDALQHLISGRQQTRGLSYDYICFSAVIQRELPVKPQMFEIADVAWLPVKELNQSNASNDTLLYLQTWQGKV